MISTASIKNDRGAVLGAFDGSTAVLAGCRMPVVGMQLVTGGAGVSADQKSVDYRITAELRASIFGGHVWLRPAATDVLVPTTGHPAWSPPI